MPRLGIHRGVSIVTAVALMMAMLTFLAVSPVAAATADLTATLSGDQEVPPVDTAATGTASVAIDTEAASGSQLCYDVASADLEGGAAVAAHIHEGAAGEAPANNVVVTLTVDAEGNGSACAADTDFNLANSGDPDIATLLADIIANPSNYYVNVHTEANAAGEIRGQLDVAGIATGEVVVMKHLCNPDIQSVEDFDAVEAAGVNGVTSDENPFAGLVATVLACPTVILPGDSFTADAINGGNVAFEFTETDATSLAQTLSADAMFEQAALCETNVGLDADGDGEMTADVCLDVSMYAFSNVAEGAVTVTETDTPGDSRFGTIRLTPGSGDEDAVISATDGVIALDTSADPDNSASDPGFLPEYGADRFTVHVYNFQAAAAASPTPAVSELPDAAVDAPATSDGLPMLVALTALGLAISAAFVLRQRAGRIG